MIRRVAVLALAVSLLAGVAHAQKPGAVLPGNPPLPGPISIHEGPEPTGGQPEPIVTIPLGTNVQAGYLVLVEPGAADSLNPANWSDVVVFQSLPPTAGCGPGIPAQYATLVSDAGESGITDADLAPAGTSIAQILGCLPFTVFQTEGTRTDELNIYQPDPNTVYQIYSDADATPFDPTHYWSYHLLSPVFSPSPIAAKDQLYQGYRPFELDSLERLVNWVRKNNSAVRDTFVHFTWWNIQNKTPVGATTIISNQFGTGRIYLSNVEFMLAPAWKNTDLPNTPNASHYLCYRATGWRPQTTVSYDMQDEWRTDIQFPDTLAYFCIPCWKQHNALIFPPTDTVTHLAVYRIKPQSEPFFPIIKDQFIAGRFLVQQFPDEYLFVPSTKGAVTGVIPGSTTSSALAMSDPAPNPARVSSNIVFTLPRSMTVRIEVYDLLGRRVRELENGQMDSGAHVVTWDLRTASGNRVRSGIYLVRLVAGDQRLHRKLVVTN